MSRRRTVGILGGGQLGTMLAESLFALDADVVVYDPHPDAPARRRVPETITRRWDDLRALASFFARCDVVTYEFEHIETKSIREALASLAAAPPIYPSLDVLDTTRDRIAEKQFLVDAGLPHAAWTHAQGRQELLAAAERFGYPFILKTARGGYDGKGQFTIRSFDALEVAIAALENSVGARFSVVLEDPLPLYLETSCIVARGVDGRTESFPLFENQHSGHVLDFTVLPARLPRAVGDAAAAIAEQAARALGVVGLLTTEFFVTRGPGRRGGGVEVDAEGADGERYHVWVNEFAPRPHNSGHVTRKACTASQFDVLARILMELEPTPPRLIGEGGFCMANLLGDVWLAQGSEQLDLAAWSAHADVLEVMLYGKEGAKSRRKMGHLLTRGVNAEAALEAARAFREALSRPRGLARRADAR